MLTEHHLIARLLQLRDRNAWALHLKHLESWLGNQSWRLRPSLLAVLIAACIMWEVLGGLLGGLID